MCEIYVGEPPVYDWFTWLHAFAVSGYRYVVGLVLTKGKNIKGYSSEGFDGCVLRLTLFICEGRKMT